MKFDLSRIQLPLPPRILNALVPSRLFAKLNIASKMLLGYMVLVLLSFIVVVYALVSLQRLNSLNESIVTVDIPVQEAADKMLDALFAQDVYEKRFLIMKSGAMQNLFMKRGTEFRTWLTTLTNLQDQDDLALQEIERLHDAYMKHFSEEAAFVKKRRMKEAQDISEEKLKHVFESLVDTIRATSTTAKAAQDRKMKLISEIGGSAFLTTALLLGASILVGALAGFVVTHHIASSLQKLKVATEHVSEGNFDYDPQIQTADEIGSLSDAFIAMGKRLRKLEEMYLDASPLTRLPGGIAIENVLKKRIESSHPLAFCVIDLDNFKAFNDRYGYANGSEVIKETARLIEAAVKASGSSEDFIGHVGGDDFVVITTPDLIGAVCTDIIARFDKRIPEFYEEADRAKGYIMGKTRQGVTMQFPIMTISIAIVTNERRKLTDPLQASEIAAELKDYAKTIPKSVYVVDKRRTI